MSDKYKFVTLKDHEYQIGKFSALEGAFIVAKVSGLIAPMVEPLLKGMTADKLKLMSNPTDFDLSSIQIGAIFQPLANIPEADFFYLQEKCLRVCRLKISNGYKDVLNDNGTLAFDHLEDDGMAVMALMVHALVFNLTGFIQGSGLTGFLTGILATSQSN